MSKLQEEVEAYERAKILKDNMGANEAMCRHEADAQQRHQEIMSKLALERERQLLELDTAWRKQVRLLQWNLWHNQLLCSFTEANSMVPFVGPKTMGSKSLPMQLVRKNSKIIKHIALVIKG